MMDNVEALRVLDAKIDHLTNLFAALQMVVDPILTGPVNAESRGQVSALWGVIDSFEDALPKAREALEVALAQARSHGGKKINVIVDTLSVNG
jgi:hypothetical protein